MRGQIIFRIITKSESHLSTMVLSKAPQRVTIDAMIVEALAESLMPSSDASMRVISVRNDGSLKVLDIGLPN